VNRSTNLLLTEMVIFELENLQIDGLEGEKQVFVRVGPGEEQLIKLINVSEGERKLSSKVVEKKIVLYEKPPDSPSYKRKGSTQIGNSVAEDLKNLNGGNP
jgi:hypothetical protein